MPPRLNKRQQRELEELEALNAVNTKPDNLGDLDEPRPQPATGGGFSAASFRIGE